MSFRVKLRNPLAERGFPRVGPIETGEMSGAAGATDVIIYGTGVDQEPMLAANFAPACYIAHFRRFSAKTKS